MLRGTGTAGGQSSASAASWAAVVTGLRPEWPCSWKNLRGPARVAPASALRPLPAGTVLLVGAFPGPGRGGTNPVGKSTTITPGIAGAALLADCLSSQERRVRGGQGALGRW